MPRLAASSTSIAASRCVTSLELRFLVSDNRQLVLEKVPHFYTWVRVPILNGQQLTDFPQGKPQSIGASYKRQTIDSRFCKFPVARCGSGWWGEQPLLLVKTHGFKVDFGALRKLSSREDLPS